MVIYLKHPYLHSIAPDGLYNYFIDDAAACWYAALLNEAHGFDARPIPSVPRGGMFKALPVLAFEDMPDPDLTLVKIGEIGFYSDQGELFEPTKPGEQSDIITAETLHQFVEKARGKVS